MPPNGIHDELPPEAVAEAASIHHAVHHEGEVVGQGVFLGQTNAQEFYARCHKRSAVESVNPAIKRKVQGANQACCRLDFDQEIQQGVPWRACGRPGNAAGLPGNLWFVVKQATRRATKTRKR